MKTSHQEMIESRIELAFSPEHLTVIDESKQHAGHSGYSAAGSHFQVVISSTSFSGLSKIEIHRKIYALFDDMIPESIHALSIKLICLPRVR